MRVGGMQTKENGTSWLVAIHPQWAIYRVHCGAGSRRTCGWVTCASQLVPHCASQCVWLRLFTHHMTPLSANLATSGCPTCSPFPMPLSPPSAGPATTSLATAMTDGCMSRATTTDWRLKEGRVKPGELSLSLVLKPPTGVPLLLLLLAMRGLLPGLCGNVLADDVLLLLLLGAAGEGEEEDGEMAAPACALPASRPSTMMSPEARTTAPAHTSPNTCHAVRRRGRGRGTRRRSGGKFEPMAGECGTTGQG